MKRRFWLIMALTLLSVTLCGCIGVEFDGWPAENGEEGDFGVHLPGVSVDFNAHPADDEAGGTPTAPLPQEDTPQTDSVDAAEPPQETQVPAAIFDFDTVDLDGNAVNTREFASGRDLTLVNFWATWCGPCVNEMPELQSLHERFSADTEGADVALLGVWLDTESRSDMESVLEYTGAAYPMVEFRSEMQTVVALQYIPATIFLDAEGNLVGEPVVGAQDAEGWLKEIETRLAALGLA